MGRRVGNSGMVEGAVGVEGNGGGQQWGCRQHLRTALHNLSVSLQNSLS